MRPFFIIPLDEVKLTTKRKQISVKVEKKNNDGSYLLSNSGFCIVGRDITKELTLEIGKEYIIIFNRAIVSVRKRFEGFLFLKYEILIDSDSKTFELPSAIPSLSSIDYPSYLYHSICLQNWLEDLNEENFDQILKNILNSIFVDNKCKMKILIRNMAVVMKIRKNMGGIMTKLALNITKTKKEFKKYFLKFFKRNPTFKNYASEIFQSPNDFYDFEILEDHKTISFAIKNDLIDQFKEIFCEDKYSRTIDSQFSMFMHLEEETLIDIAAIYGSVNIFKFLVINGDNITTKTADCAVAGGNSEIINIIRQKNVDFVDSLSTAVLYRRDSIYEWIQRMQENNVPINFKIYTRSLNYEVLYQNCIMGKVNASDIPIEPIMSHKQFELVELFFDGLDDFADNFMTALIRSDLNMTKLFIKHGANVNKKFGSLTPLTIAIMYEKNNIAKELIDNGADLNPKNVELSPLCVAVEGNKSGLKLLLENGAIPSGDILFHAKHIGTIKTLIEYGADINAKNEDGFSLLWQSILVNDADKSLFLIESGADVCEVNKKGESLLHYTILNKKTRIAIELIEHGANIDSENSDYSPLIAAISNNMFDIVKILVEKGADVSIVTSSGTLALTAAFSTGNIKMAEYLLDHGAPCNTNDFSETPIIFACKNNLTELTKKMINQGASSNSYLPGNSPLHYAVINNNIELVDFLLKHDAEVNSANQNRETPLFIAAKNNYREVANILIENGANINSTDIYGTKTKDYLIQNNII